MPHVYVHVHLHEYIICLVGAQYTLVGCINGSKLLQRRTRSNEQPAR